VRPNPSIERTSFEHAISRETKEELGIEADVSDQGEREKCLSNTNTTYEDYKRETGSGNK
jgi:hypothetical protein